MPQHYGTSNVLEVLISATLQQYSLLLALLLISVGILLKLRSSNAVLLVDFACFNPPQRLKTSREWLLERVRACNLFTEESVQWLEKIGKGCGISHITAFSEGSLEFIKTWGDMTKEELNKGVSLDMRYEEADLVMFSTIQSLLDKTGVHPSEIGAVVTSGDCFAPEPSLSARIVNHYKLPHTVLTYSTAGMGCANVGICMDLARHLLNSNPGMLCLIVSHENMGSSTYVGNDRSLLLPLALFRMSGAALLLSNRKRDRAKAKYDINLLVRTHIGADDEAHTCIKESTDADGVVGIRINKSVIPSAAKATKVNLRRVGLKVLPYTELVKAGLNKMYMPDFKTAFEHFLFQAGGRGVLNEMQKAFCLTDQHLKPSRDSLLRFANTAGASSVYSLLALESGSGVKKGDRTLGLMFGAGFKAVSVVLRARRDIHEEHPLWRDTHPETQRAANSLSKAAAETKGVC